MAKNPLEIAKQLSCSRFAGWTYGHDSSKKQVNCVRFLLAVVEELLTQCVSVEVKNRILVSGLGPTGKAQLPSLVGAEDNRIRGVQYALTSINRGEIVAPRDAQVGDMVQYWMKRANGTWFGHAAILEHVELSGASPLAKLYGAHESINAIGVSNYKLQLNGLSRKVFIVRVK